MDRRSNAQTSRVGQLFNTLCQYNTRTGYGIVGYNHFTHCNTHPYPGLDVVIEFCYVIVVFRLECKRSSYRVGGALELGQKRIAPEFSHLTLIFSDGVAETSKGILYALMSQLFILLNQRG
jgi:hypothetical protein